MALIKCTKCGHEISDKATVCPRCGNIIAIVEEKKSSTTKSIIAIVLLVLLACGTFFFLNKGNETNKDAANSETAKVGIVKETNELDRSNARVKILLRTTQGQQRLYFTAL